MIRCFATFVILVSVCFVSGCQERDVSYSRLLQDMNLLQAEYDRCMSQTTKTPGEQAECQVVNKAAKTISDLLARQRSQPEKFGFEVLEAEMAVQTWQDKITKLNDDLAKLNATGARQELVSDAQAKLDAAIAVHATKQQEVVTLLAVIGLSSPE